MNPWLARAAKFLAAVATGVVILGNSWVNGPAWLYPVAAIIGPALVYFVPNAPKYSDPRQRNLR